MEKAVDKGRSIVDGFPVGIRLRKCSQWSNQYSGKCFSVIVMFDIEWWGVESIILVIGV